MAFVDSLLKVGDRVIMNMSEDSRGWLGTEYPPNGTLGTFKGRTRYQTYRERYGSSMMFHVPGIYELDGAAIIEWDNGSTAVDGWSHEMLDKAEYNRRFEEYHADPNKWQPDFRCNAIRVGDLPELKFMETDIVRVQGITDYFIIDGIQYHWYKPEDDRGWCYNASWVNENGWPMNRGHTYLHDSELELVKRGNVWRELNNEPLEFRDIKHEAVYEKNRGRCIQIRNPANNLYKWELDEALQAIRQGYASCLIMGNGLFNGKELITVWKYDKLDLHERLRKETMEGFPLERR